MRLGFIILFGVVLFFGCELKGVDTSKEGDSVETKDTQKESEEKTLQKEDTLKVYPKKPEIGSDTLRLDNGIKIIYFNKGTGETIKKGDIIKIDYRAKLKDGTVFDGTHLVKKPSIPFLVGWNQQTKGWDMAIEKLRVGDDVDIFIPAQYARGEAGIPGIVPPNADNIISLRILEKFKPIKVVDGIQIWKYDEWKEPGDSIALNDKVSINYWVSSESNPRYDNSYQRGESFKLVMGDASVLPGLYKALLYGREGDRLLIKIPPKEAFGSKGLQDFVKPNESVFYDIQIEKVKK